MEKLDPCWMCKGEMRLYLAPGSKTEYAAHCPKCDLLVEHLDGTEEDAIRQFNEVARADIDSPDVR